MLQIIHFFTNVLERIFKFCDLLGKLCCKLVALLHCHLQISEVRFQFCKLLIYFILETDIHLRRIGEDLNGSVLFHFVSLSVFSRQRDINIRDRNTCSIHHFRRHVYDLIERLLKVDISVECTFNVCQNSRQFSAVNHDTDLTFRTGFFSQCRERQHRDHHHDGDDQAEDSKRFLLHISYPFRTFS